jgi:hypothetical protein
MRDLGHVGDSVSEDLASAPSVTPTSSRPEPNWKAQFQARAALFDTFLVRLGSDDPSLAMKRLDELLNPPPPSVAMADAAEMLWVVLANVSGGDWTKQSADWQEAAARWRDNYFAAAWRAIQKAEHP